ncbi:MAG: type II toxin-antitoxin system HicB family antitoxin [Candidatus Bathyarchaeota archaeon]|nr:MAG: type II toxin-antitoxin system HicB family antitoxin [Candidatus Bathyarchaeota archaeon]
MNLEHGERWWYAHVAELPGCFTRGETHEEVLNSLPKEIDRHLSFLREKGCPSTETTMFLVAQEIHDIAELGEAGGAVALFDTDERPVCKKDLEIFLELIQWNREELLRVVCPLPKEARDARPIHDKWTINETLNHVANAEEWYISRLGEAIQEECEGYIERLDSSLQEDDVLKRLAVTRQGAVHALRAAFSRGVRGTFTRAKYAHYPEERWTFRKVLRRFVEHEREHINTIKRVVEALA